MAETVSHLPAVRVLGLMAIPPVCQESTENHKFFQKMREIGVDIMRKKYDNVRVDIMSMGMSGDYAEAIAEAPWFGSALPSSAPATTRNNIVRLNIQEELLT